MGLTAEQKKNAPIAFALVCGAGLSTALGALVVFFPALVKLASRRVLAGALGIAAGVMTYLSFVEIFGKSQGSFQEAGFSEKESYTYATLCFFGGVVVMLLMDYAVKQLSGSHGHGHSHDGNMAESEENNNNNQEDDESHIRLACCSPDAVGDLERIQKQAKILGEHQHQHPPNSSQQEGLEVTMANMNDSTTNNDNTTKTTKKAAATNESVNNNDTLDATEQQKGDTKNTSSSDDGENKKLVRMGVSTALAIGLHNFPEGLATFVATLADPSVGAVLAIAIVIHNIPEGLCVALPIYYATGNRTKAFLWALVSGVSEPVAALLGWAILAGSFSDSLYAVMFGLVGGMMVIISTRELIPTAHRYDPQDTVVTYSFIVGMGIMAASLVLFTL